MTACALSSKLLIYLMSNSILFFSITYISWSGSYTIYLMDFNSFCDIYLHRFYASWCKSCARFGQRYRHFAFEEGDHINIENSIVHTGKVRFAEVEYSASAKLCKSLKVRKLPTTHMYRKGKGKVADMVCKPSQFQDVADKVHDLLDGGDGDVAAALLGGESFEQPAILELAAETKTLLHAAEVTASKSNVNVTNTSFESLGDEIMSSLKQNEGTVNTITGNEKEVEKEKSWFPFSF